MSVADPAAFKREVVAALWRAVDRSPSISSATLAGSFATGGGLDGFSDIDTIVVVDSLDRNRFEELQAVFREELAPVLAREGWSLRMNATLGPLKFNDATTAVLHLMVYSAEGHRDHVVKSPFTCLDWQRSPVWRTAPMAEVYPVFALQPRHFFGARRSARDYLADLHAGVVSYRELSFEGGYHEVKLGKPMEVRDRHEFSYHILRFLMQNLLKLVRRENKVTEGESLLADYASVFPTGMGEFGPLYLYLARMKKNADFNEPVGDLIGRISAFATAFEDQFRDEFEHGAVRQVWVRHAPTAMNRGSGSSALLQGRSDQLIQAPDPQAVGRTRGVLAPMLAQPGFCWLASPARRAVQTAEALGAVAGGIATDLRLLEIDYGTCEGLTAGEAMARHPELLAGWKHGQDPAFPGGESSAMVCERAVSALQAHNHPAVVVTHNVVLREVLGSLMHVPAADRHRIAIPHLAPIGLVCSRRFGWFADLDEDVEIACFGPFFADSPRRQD